MKVLMVTNAIAPDKLGGLERYVRELAATLVRKGHDVTTLSKRTDPTNRAHRPVTTAFACCGSRPRRSPIPCSWRSIPLAWHGRCTERWWEPTTTSSTATIRSRCRPS